MGKEHVAGSAQAEGVSLVGAGGRIGAGEDMGALQVVPTTAASALPDLSHQPREDAACPGPVVPSPPCPRRWSPPPPSRPIHVVPGGAERSNGGVLDGAPLF